MTSTLEIRDLHVTVESDGADKEILTGVTLTIRAGETHAVMGPNGSGKSTLAYAIAGHPKYTVTSGAITLDGEDVLAMSVDERARAGVFLAMQYPVEVPGVSVSNFLRSSATAVRGEAPKLRLWVKEQKEAMARLEMDPAFSEASTRASPVVRRSATRSCSSSCCVPGSPSWTRPTPASTSTRCGSSPRGSTGSAKAGRPASC
jgi:FeS assembly ATPase SufC